MPLRPGETIEPIWYTKIERRGKTWSRYYTFPGYKRSRDALGTRDRDDAARTVKEEWAQLEVARQTQRLVDMGVIEKSRLDVRKRWTVLEATAEYMTDRGPDMPSHDHLLRRNKVVLEHFGEDTLISAIDEDAVVAFRRSVELRERVIARRRGGGTRPIKPSSVNTYVDHLRTVMRFARHAKADCAPEEIAWGDVSLTEEDREDYIPTAEEIAAIRSHFRPDAVYLLDFSYETGIRRDNSITLSKPQVKRDRRFMTLRVKSKKRSAVAKRADGRAASGHLQDVVLSPRALEILDRVWGDHPTLVFTYSRQRPFHSAPRNGMPRVRTERGERLKIGPSSLQTWWNEACEKAGVIGSTWHSLRGACAQRLSADGVPLEVIAAHLGHSATYITERYLKPKRKRVQAWIERGGEATPIAPVPPAAPPAAPSNTAAAIAEMAANLLSQGVSPDAVSQLVTASLTQLGHKAPPPNLKLVVSQ